MAKSTSFLLSAWRPTSALKASTRVPCLCGVLLHLHGGLFGFVVIENDVRAGLGEKFYCRRADASRTSSNQCRFARQ